MITALSRLCRSMQSRTSRGLIMRMPSNERRLAVAVEGLGREPAGVDLAALGHELLKLVVEVQVAREGLVAEPREAALDTEGDAGAVEQDRGLEALALQAGGLEQVHEAMEPSKATVWKVTSAFWPGSAFTSSKTFSS